MADKSKQKPAQTAKSAAISKTASAPKASPTKPSPDKAADKSLYRKSDLIDKVSAVGNLTKSNASEVIDLVLMNIKDLLGSGKSLMLLGFGTFAVKTVAARTGRHPQTGAPLTIPASNVVRFKAGEDLKKAINK